ncbi:MAG TPA: nicotinate-nucleotide adenylyltransferase [Bryobacteraceae bacterium]|nr:nicotinate-nucleotide adenylyltransferase [Bryobacteraceae bacterium]
MSAEQPPAVRSERVGVIGGTFDPIHAGHLILAEETRLALSLSRVIFVPAGHPWRKANRDITPAADRMAMVSLAVASNSTFDVSSIEVVREGPTYTADTLQEVRAQLHADTDLWFILGSDALLDLEHWHDPGRIVALARLAVAVRDSATAGSGALRLGGLEDLVSGVRDRIDVVAMPRVGISSSEIRRRLRQGISCRYWLPAKVERYAVERNLYGRPRQCP